MNYVHALNQINLAIAFWTYSVSSGLCGGPNLGRTDTRKAPTVAWNTYSNMESGGSTHHGDSLRRPNPENEPFSILDILPLLRSLCIRGEKWGEIQAAAYHPASARFFLRRHNPENELFSVMDNLMLLRARVIIDYQ